MGSWAVETVESEDQWGISKDAFAPPPMRRVIRGWDRAPVEAHVPRLQGMKVWKKVCLKENETGEDPDEMQLELEKDGAGARKRARVEGTKQNIGDAGWGNMKTVTIDFVDDNLGTVLNGGLSNSPVKRSSSETGHDETPSELQFVPRKRTNNNHVITPKKKMRQTTLDRHTKRPSMAGTPQDVLPRSSRTRKSLRKSFRRSTLGSLPIEESMFRDIKSSEAVEEKPGEDNKSLLGNEPCATEEQPKDRRTSLRRSIRDTRASALNLSDQPATKSSVLPANDVPMEEVTTDEKFPEAELAVTDATTSTSPVQVVLSDDLNLNATATIAGSPGAVEKPYVEEPTDAVAASVTEFHLAKKSVIGGTPKRWGLSNAAAESPCQSSPMHDVKITRSTSETPRHPTIHELLSASSPTIAPPTLKSPARYVEAFSTAPVLSMITETFDCPSLTPPAEVDIAETHAEIPIIEVTDVSGTSPECETATPEPKVESSEETPERTGDVPEGDGDSAARTGDAPGEITDQNSALPNLTSSTYDHDDTDMLRNFLTRVKANKAAMKSPNRKRQLTHSPLRVPLGDVDHNLSPSPLRPKDDFDLAELSPTKRGRRSKADAADTDDTAELAEPASCRRSGRTRIPSKAPPAGPSFIPVRRLGQDPDTTVTLKRTEEKELAALTRINTRKNKGGAVGPAAVLAKKADEKEDPVLRQRLLKEAFDEKTEKGKSAKGKGNSKGKGKMVAWAEQLARFQVAEKVAGDKEREKEKEKEKEKEGLLAEEKKTAVRVGVRSKVALGMAMNGTPAPKRRMRAHV